MEYRQLGRSGLKVSVLTLGTMSFGGRGEFEVVGSVEVAEARRMLDACLDAGVNLIDTADLYSSGVSEEIVGEVIRGRRDRVLISTKAAFPMGPGPNERGLSRHHLVEACDASLRRLGVDHIDIYHAHMWDGMVPLEETLLTLASLVDQGKVRYLACSNHSAWHVMKALGVSERLGIPGYVSQQIYYSLLAREAEYELVPLSVDQGLGILVWGPLAGGFLTGKYGRGGERPDVGRHLTDWDSALVRHRDVALDIVDALADIARDHDATVAQAALAYVMGKPAVTSVIIGARTGEQLMDNLKAAGWQLEEADRARLDELSEIDLLYPYFHQAEANAERLSAADLTLLQRFITE